MSEQDPTTDTDTVTGRFVSPESARAAMVRLESAGIDADAITLEDTAPAVAPSDVATENDLEATGDVGKGAGIGAAIGAAAGAAAGVVTGLVTGDAGAGSLVGTTGAVGGSVVGGLAGTYAGLPANPSAWETYEMDPNNPHPVTVVVRVDSPEQARAARIALQGEGSVS
jgi:hypothetical protein